MKYVILNYYIKYLINITVSKYINADKQQRIPFSKYIHKMKGIFHEIYCKYVIQVGLQKMCVLYCLDCFKFCCKMAWN